LASTPPDRESSTFLAACRRDHLDDEVPVWFMRQAGRSLPEYRRLRAGIGMLESCRRPDLVAEITLQPVRRHGVDAAIFYSDIMVPLAASGVGVEIVAGTGPVIAEPIRRAADLHRIRPLQIGDLGFVGEAVGLITAELGATPLIGFAGAPFTLASYLVEGGPSRDYARTKTLMISEPELWHDLCRRLGDMSATFLETQVAAGARAVQLFDSWAGSLSAVDYLRYVQPHSAAVLQRVRRLGVPTIHFGVGTSELLELMAAAGADVVGVDWTVDLGAARKRVGPGVALQGNLDPAALFAGGEAIRREVAGILASFGAVPGDARNGHIFNLGHGISQHAPPESVAVLVDAVHGLSAPYHGAAA